MTARTSRFPPGHLIDRMDGLDPVNCEGYRKALRDRGFAVAAFGLGGTITPPIPQPSMGGS